MGLMLRYVLHSLLLFSKLGPPKIQLGGPRRVTWASRNFVIKKITYSKTNTVDDSSNNKEKSLAVCETSCVTQTKTDILRAAAVQKSDFTFFFFTLYILQ